jgi:hypothetical protein
LSPSPSLFGNYHGESASSSSSSTTAYHHNFYIIPPSVTNYDTNEYMYQETPMYRD